MVPARGAALIDPIRETPSHRPSFRDPDGYVFEVVEEDRDGRRLVGSHDGHDTA